MDGRLQIEKHHVAGRNHDPELTSPLCLACHAQATENLRRSGVDMRYTRDRVERVRRALKAAAVFLRMLAEALCVGPNLCGDQTAEED